MKKTCYLNLATYSQTGGIENYNKTFLKALNEIEGETTSLSVYDSENKQKFKNVEFKNCNKNKIKASLYLLKNIYKFDNLITAHINLLPIAILAKIFKPKLKVYLSIYGIEVWKKLPISFVWFLKRIKILSISTYTTKKFKAFNNISKEKVFYLPPDTDNSINKDFENVYNKNNFNILSVTRLDSSDCYKGVDSMIKTIPLLIEKIPNIKYTVIGKGDDKDRLITLTKELKVEKYVEFKGFVEHIEPYYQYCNVFSLPSKGEGFGIVYIEAMKYKKACIACDEGGQTDVVIDGKTGYLCKYDDIECLADKMYDLYSDRPKSNTFGTNGFKHFVDNFTFLKFQQRLKIILKD